MTRCSLGKSPILGDIGVSNDRDDQGLEVWISVFTSAGNSRNDPPESLELE